MASTIQLKRSALSGKVPNTGSLNLGELALNTYDGKIFFRRSGSTDSVQEVITTNTTNTGSVTITGTLTAASIVGSISASNGVVSGSSQVISILTSLNAFTASENTKSTTLGALTGSLATTGSNTFVGAQTFNSDITVLGAVNARQFNIGIISSSILYTSGSNKFGDTTDDIHQFTGSVSITGSVTATSFIGDGSGLTGMVVDLSTAQLNDVDGNNIPARSFAELFLACAVAEIVDLDFGL